MRLEIIATICGVLVIICATACFMYSKHISYLKLSTTKRYEFKQQLLNAEKETEQ